MLFAVIFYNLLYHGGMEVSGFIFDDLYPIFSCDFNVHMFGCMMLK